MSLAPQPATHVVEAQAGAAQAAAQSPAVDQGTPAGGVSQMALQPPSVYQMPLQPPNDVNSALASHRASVMNCAQAAAQAVDYVVAVTQTAAAATQATDKAHGTAADGVSPTSLQPASDMNSIQRQQVYVAQATAQAVVQAVAQGVAAAKTVVVAVQTTRDAHRTAADEMSPMAREPTSDMTSAQGEQVAAKVGIREYERQRIKYSTGGGKVASQEGISNRDWHIDFGRLGMLDDANQHPGDIMIDRLGMLDDANQHHGDVMIVEPQIPITPSSLEIPNIRNLTNLERTQGKAFQSDPQCKFEDHALARTAVWTGSARRRRYWIWHQRHDPVGGALSGENGAALLRVACHGADASHGRLTQGYKATRRW